MRISAANSVNYHMLFMCFCGIRNVIERSEKMGDESVVTMISAAIDCIAWVCQMNGGGGMIYHINNVYSGGLIIGIHWILINICH
jgi:hypothetical protein